MFAANILICGTHLSLEVTDSAGEMGVVSAVVSRMDPDKTTIKTQMLTFNHWTIPVVCTVHLADTQNNSKKAKSQFPMQENKRTAISE